MANASFIRNFGELERYGEHLIREANELNQEYVTICKRINQVSQSWDDKSQQKLKESVEAEAKRIQMIVEKVQQYGKEVRTYARSKQGTNNRFCSKF